MDEKLKDRTMMISLLRISAFLFLVGYVYVIFVDETFFMALWISFPAFWYTLGHYSWLILPVLFNVALWFPRRYTYLFLKALLRIEKYRLGVIFVLNVLIMIPGGFVLDRVSETARASGGAWLYVFIALGVIKHEDIRAYFGWYDEKEDWGYTHRKYVHIFAVYLIIFSIGLGERIIAYSNYDPMVEQTQRSVYALNDLSSIDIAVDKEMYLGIFSEGAFKDDIGIYALGTGKEIKKLGVKGAWQGYFVPDSNNILIRRLDTEGVKKSWHYEIVDMDTVEEKMRMEQVLHGEGFFADKLLFSDNGRYFATVGRGMSIWDCKEGKEITYVDSSSYIETLAWTSENTTLMLNLPKKEKFNDLDNSIRSIKQCSIAENQKAIWDEKEKITASLRQKIDSLRIKQRSISLEKGNKKYTVLLVASGTLKSNYLREKTYIELWDVQNEEVLFSLELDERITAAQVHPDEKRLVVFKGGLMHNVKISYWDINSKEKEKERIIAKLEIGQKGKAFPERGKALAFTEQGKKIIWLENKLYIVALEE